jgi:hypothetical protein
MALRIGRGLFRLWLVLSVLWIGGVGAVTWWTFPMDYWVGANGEELPSIAELNAALPKSDPKTKIVEFEGQRHEFPADATDAEIAAALEGTSRLVTDPALLAQLNKPDPSQSYQVARDKERRAAVQLAAILTLVPAFLLALGSALVWAFRGFRY